MKKTLIFKSMLIAAMLVTSSALMAQKKYAVLICSGSDKPITKVNDKQGEEYYEDANAEAWKETFLIFEQLMKKGYKPEDTYVLFREGKDYSENHYVYSRYKPQAFIKITDMAANHNNLINTFKHLAEVVKEQDSVLIAVFDNESNSKRYKNDNLCHTEINTLLQNIKAKHKKLLTHKDIRAYIKQ